MNRQNFEAKDRFPLSTQALTFMQDMVMATAQLALIGGDNYILSGCEISGHNATPGIIVINGEVMPFEGGAIVETITIVETSIPVKANGIEYENARTTRKAKFATGSGANYYPWSAFRPLSTNKQLEEAKATVKYVNDEIAKLEKIPAGVIVMWSGSVTNIPQGWQLCDYSLIPGTSKRTPDLRGRFIVGYNSTVGSGYNSITAGPKSTDQYKVTLTVNEMPSHNHNMPQKSATVLAGEWGIIRRSTKNENLTAGSFNKDGAGDEPDLSHSPMSVAIPFQGNGQSFDIRPPYYVLAYIIKL